MRRARRTMGGATHVCPRRGCGERVPDSMFCCVKDWYALSGPARARIGQTSGLTVLATPRRAAIEAARAEWEK